MKETYVIRDQSLPHFLTVTIVDWIDVFSRKSFVAARSGDHRRASRSYIKLRRAGVHTFRGPVLIAKAAFSSYMQLASTMGHELNHVIDWRQW